MYLRRIATLWIRSYYYPHYPDEKTEVWRESVTGQRSHGQGSNPELHYCVSDFRAFVLNRSFQVDWSIRTTSVITWTLHLEDRDHALPVCISSAPRRYPGPRFSVNKYPWRDLLHQWIREWITSFWEHNYMLTAKCICICPLDTNTWNKQAKLTSTKAKFCFVPFYP